MMQNRPPVKEPFASPGWINWLNQVFQCLPWKKAINVTARLNFPSVSANSESAGISVVADGARQGDVVQVTPISNTVGVLYKGRVTAADTVSVYACNFTVSAADPASMQFRILVIQD